MKELDCQLAEVRTASEVVHHFAAKSGCAVIAISVATAARLPLPARRG